MTDRWAMDNHNSVVLARSGAGKSYLTKLEALRSLYQGVQVLVVDPEDEYARLASAVGGTHVALGAEGVRINPLDLPTTGTFAAMRSGGVHCSSTPSLRCCWGDVSAPPTKRRWTPRSLPRTRRPGSPRTPAPTARPAPTAGGRRLATGRRRLRGGANAGRAPRPAHLRLLLRPCSTDPTTTPAAGHLQVFSLKHLPEELKAIGTLLVLDAIWRQVVRTGAEPATGDRR